MTNKKVGLLILDGWGIGDHSHSDAIYHANTPVMDGLLAKYPNAQLLTSGENVGLPDGQMGNSEVGHMNIGAGRIVYQELTRINKSIREGDFFQNPVLKRAFTNAKLGDQKVHFIGLVSEGGVHSAQNHLHALCDMAKEYDLRSVFIHAFTDGRDCDPKSGKGFLQNLQKHIEGSRIQIASVIGRYYAMDRDKRWERIQKAYNLLTKKEGERFRAVDDVFDYWYSKGITDEFIEPSVVNCDITDSFIEEGDLVICFNFRTDRPREIITVLTQHAIDGYNMQPIPLDILTMTRYDDTFKGIDVIFEKDNLNQTLGQVVSEAGKTQVRIAETEKYPHVTFFFSGGNEVEFPGEKRILVNSPKVATYDLQPEMSAVEVTNKITEELITNTPDFFCLNFANPDMVGHTGVYDAIVKAVETVDSCLGRVVETAVSNNYELIVIADHGNADYAVNADGTPNTQHSLNPVPVVLVTNENIQLNNGILADVAPTILARMGIEQPTVMTGKSLVK
ncbi:MAG: 2,3-bisphosphoglycerate-independent phosphoglycerate mutase [Brumimicrobium sp.]|nr:2,3-bisphosphoglycerate-independent phosphoglycerate mutase [Brumimicrobium sp.]MCO5269408.1 2,3-bisphosphoglycerate-independent phosphoglycerate mutase [Brumimicrobium sp.]